MFGFGKKEEKKEVEPEVTEKAPEIKVPDPVVPEITPIAEEPEPVEEVKLVLKKPTEEHVHDENCKHEHNEQTIEDPNAPPPLTRKEAKHLKRAKYNPNDTKFNTSYVLKNKRTGQVVEIRAASSFHACNIIGWKPNRVTLLAQRTLATEAQGDKEVKREASTPETVSSSNT